MDAWVESAGPLAAMGSRYQENAYPHSPYFTPGQALHRQTRSSVDVLVLCGLIKVFAEARFPLMSNGEPPQQPRSGPV